MIIKALAFILFSFLSAYVLLFGKEHTGIKIDYAFTSSILAGVILLL